MDAVLFSPHLPRYDNNQLQSKLGQVHVKQFADELIKSFGNHT